MTIFDDSTNFDTDRVPFETSSDFDGLMTDTSVSVNDGQSFEIVFNSLRPDETVMEVTAFIKDTTDIEVTIEFKDNSSETVNHLTC